MKLKVLKMKLKNRSTHAIPLQLTPPGLHSAMKLPLLMRQLRKKLLTKKVLTKPPLMPKLKKRSTHAHVSARMDSQW